jgi:hypothetical protein
MVMKHLAFKVFLSMVVLNSCVTYTNFFGTNEFSLEAPFNDYVVYIAIGSSSREDGNMYRVSLGVKDHTNFKPPRDSISFDSVCIRLYERNYTICVDSMQFEHFVYGVYLEDVGIPKGTDSLQVSFDVLIADKNSLQSVVRQSVVHKLYRKEQKFLGID